MLTSYSDMNHFICVCLITFSSLFWVTSQKKHLISPPIKRYPSWVLNYQEDIKETFKRRELANVMLAGLTGKRDGISFKTKNTIQRLNLFFLLSPGAFHVGVIISCLAIFIRRTSNIRMGLQLVLMLINQKNIFLLLRNSITKFLPKLKLKISPEYLAIIVFVFLYLIQNKYTNPLSLICTYAFVATFISLRTKNKITLFIGIYIISLIINLFLKQKISFLSIPLSFIFAWFYIGIFILIISFYSTFFIFKINWVEYSIGLYIDFAHYMSKNIQGSFSASSLFLIFSLIILINVANFKIKTILFGLFLLLHCDVVSAPAILYY